MWRSKRRRSECNVHHVLRGKDAKAQKINQKMQIAFTHLGRDNLLVVRQSDRTRGSASLPSFIFIEPFVARGIPLDVNAGSG
jgi:hypothetical protein